MTTQPPSIYDIYKKARKRGPERDMGAVSTVLDFVEIIYRKINLPTYAFARQVGVEAQTVRLWLKRSGNVPTPKVMEKLIYLYQENFKNEF